MNEDLNGLDFSFDNLPPELLNNPDNDIFRGFADHDLDLDSLLNSSLIEENGCEGDLATAQLLGTTGTIELKTSPSSNALNGAPLDVGNGVEVKLEPDGAPNQSPVLESLLKSSVVTSQCVNPAPQANTSFSPTITTRSDPTVGSLNDNEALLAALLKRHEEDRKILDHLVTDIQRKSGRESIKQPAVVPQPPKHPAVVPQTLKHPTVVPQAPKPASVVPQTLKQPAVVPLPVTEQPLAQVVVATPVNARPVGIISGTRMFVTKPAVRPAAPDMLEDMDIGEEEFGAAMDDDEGPYRPKTKRRSSHNAIEKRYRLSINMRIDEMRTLIDGADSKLSKSAVLRRAIERIRAVERENYLLRKELAAAGITPRCSGARGTWAEVKNDFNSLDESASSPESLPVSSTSPPSSMGGSPPHSPPEQAPNAAGARAPRLAHLLRKPEPQGTALLAALGSRTRVCLAAFFLGLFLVNPLALWDLGTGANTGARMVSPGGAVAHGGRTILSYWEKEGPARGGYLYLGAAAAAAVLLLLIMLLSRRRRAPPEKSQVAVSEDDMDFLVWRHWMQAESRLAEADWRRAVSELKSVLVVLGNPLPIGRFDWLRFVLRHVMAWLGVTPLISLPVKPSTGDLNCRALSKLLSLSQHGHLPLTTLQRLALSLSVTVSLRLSRELSRSDRCRVLVNLSFALPLCSSRLRAKAAKALQQPGGAELAPGLAWMLTPEGFAFLRAFAAPQNGHQLHSSPFGAAPTRVDLSEGVSLVAFAFRRGLLEQAVELLASKDDERLEEVLRLLSLVIEYSSEADLLTQEGSNQLEVSAGMDGLQHWWANMTSVAALWQLERWEQSRAHHAVAESLPRGVKARVKLRDGGGGNNLAQAVQIAYRVQRRAIFGPSEVTRPCGHNALKMAEEAASFFETMATGGEDHEKHFWLWSALACDWLLSARLALNQPPNVVEGTDESVQIGNFERDLATLQACLRRASLSGSDLFRRWSVLHQARLRLWCGSHPVRTSIALRRGSVDKEEEEEERSSELGRVRDWLQQRLLRARPTGGISCFK